MKFNNKVLLLSLFIVSLFLCMNISEAHEGCGDGLLSDDEGNSIKITSISPDVLTPLVVGHTVDLELEVSYQVAEPNAVVTLVLQKGEMLGSHVSAVIVSKAKVLDNTAGHLTMKQSFVVPETGAVMLITPLMSSGGGSTSVSDSRAYRVLDENGEEVVIDTVAKPSEGISVMPSYGSDVFRILSFEPDNSEPLYVGETINVEYVVKYKVDTVPAQVSLTIQKIEITENYADLIVSSQREVVNNKEGEITFTDNIVVPDTGSLMFTTHVVTDMNKPPDAEHRQYKQYSVEKRK